MTRWRWGHLQFSQEVGLPKLPLKRIGMTPFEKDLLHANDRFTAGVTKMPNCCFISWERCPAGVWPKSSVAGGRDETELGQIMDVFVVHRLWGCVTDRSQSVPRQGGWKALLHCTAAPGVWCGCAAPHTCTHSFRQPPGLAVAVEQQLD